MNRQKIYETMQVFNLNTQNRFLQANFLVSMSIWELFSSSYRFINQNVLIISFKRYIQT